MTAGVGSTGKGTESVHEVSQEELVMRRMSSGALCTGAGGFGVPAPRRWCVRCGGVCGQGVPGFRRRCVCAAPAGGVLGRRKALESGRQVTDHDSFVCVSFPAMHVSN